jgi:hypothetical protein
LPSLGRGTINRRAVDSHGGPEPDEQKVMSMEHITAPQDVRFGHAQSSTNEDGQEVVSLDRDQEHRRGPGSKCRAAKCSGQTPESRHGDLGFRVARVPSGGK